MLIFANTFLALSIITIKKECAISLCGYRDHILQMEAIIGLFGTFFKTHNYSSHG